MDGSNRYDKLLSGWQSEKLQIDRLITLTEKEKVNAEMAAMLAKLLQEKIDVVGSLENSMRNAFGDTKTERYSPQYFNQGLATGPLETRIKWELELMRLKQVANTHKISEEAGQNYAVAAKLDGIEKTLQELNKKMEVCMASILKESPQVAIKEEDVSDEASMSETMDLLQEAVEKIEKVTAKQETISKSLQDISEKTAEALKKKPVVDDVGEERVDDERMCLITDLLQELVISTEKKAEEGTMKNMKSLAEVKVKKLLEELKTIRASDLKDVEQEDNEEEEVQL